MRLWSIHPKYLDRLGLLAVWREGLLAKKVLEGKTKGYTNHPQLIKFKNYKDPQEAINAYLYTIYVEAKRRNYNFDGTKIKKVILNKKIPVTTGQIEFEFNHLLNKLKARDTRKYLEIKDIGKGKIETNPIFYLIPGEKEKYEKI